jgi:hypothetical protein
MENGCGWRGGSFARFARGSGAMELRAKGSFMTIFGQLLHLGYNLAHFTTGK